MHPFLKRTTSVIVLLFLFIFNLALPLPGVQAEDTVISCSLKCGCPSAEKCCCCKKTMNNITRPDAGHPCFRDAGCADIDAEGVICPALSHSALLSGENISVFQLASYLSGSSDIFESTIFLTPIEKPPRFFLSNHSATHLI